VLQLKCFCFLLQQNGLNLCENETAEQSGFRLQTGYFASKSENVPNIGNILKL